MLLLHNRISPKAWNEKIRRENSTVGVGITVTRPASGSDQTEEDDNTPAERQEEDEVEEEEKVVVRDCLLTVSQCQLWAST